MSRDADDEDIPLDASTLIRFGRITSVTLSPPRCVVRYGDPDDDDGGTETPPIRWLNWRSGKTRTWSPPSEGEEVLLFCPDGQVGNGVAVTGLPNDENPPAGTTLEELILFEDGARIAYDPEGHALTAVLPDGATALIDAPGGVTIRGPVSIEGDVTVSGDVTASGISLASHTHGNVQNGGGNTGQPQ